MPLVAGIAVASLTWGNLAALTQTNLKRLLAYSSISHVGYILLGLVAGNGTALTGISYYLFAYVFMTTGAFAVIIVLRQKGLIGEELDDLNGLYQRSPAAALLLLIFMLSLAGIPPTAGFMGKYSFSFADRNAPSSARGLCRALYRPCALLLLPYRRTRLAQAARRRAASIDDQRAGRGPRRCRVCHARRGVVS